MFTKGKKNLIDENNLEWIKNSILNFENPSEFQGG